MPMKKLLLLLSIVVTTLTLITDVIAQRAIGGHSLMLDQNGFIITIVPPPELSENYTWYLPPHAPPPNTAFTEGGSLTGQTVRWDQTLGYWVPTSALFISGNNVGDNVGIGTVTPNQLLEVWGISGTPNARFGSLSGTTGWSTNADVSDGYVMADGNGDLIKRNPFTITNQFAWAIGGNTNPTSSVLGTLSNNPLDIQTVGTSRMMFATNGDIMMGNPLVAASLTLEPGVGGTLTLANITNDDATINFLTIDGSNRVRYRSFSSILGVNANEGLVYDSPNIKLGATNGTTNPFVTSRFVNLNNNTLTFSTAAGATSLLTLRGSDGNVGIGTATPNNFKLEVAGSFGPTTNNTFTLGSPDVRWMDLYLGPSSLYIGVGAADQSKLGYDNADEAAQMLTVDADDDATVDASIDESGRLAVKDGLESMGNTDLTFRTNGVVRARFISETDDETEGALVPELNSVYDLGTPELRWREIYVSEGSLRIGKFSSGTQGSQNQQTVDEVTLSYVDGALVIDKPVANFGSMVPNTNNVLELGSSTNRWAELWLGPNSLHIGSDTYEGSISFDPTAKELKFNSNNTIGSSEMKIDSAGNVTIPALAAGGLLKTNIGGKIALASGGADFESPLTFSNGLTRTLNNVALGGALTASTDIPLGAFNLTFSGTGGGYVGIGTTAAPVALLSVGAASPFQVNALGAIAAATGITSSGTVTFGGLVTGIVHSTAGVLSSSPLNLAGGATEITGTLGVTNGGTGLATVTAQALLIGNGTSAMNELTIGTDGDVLTVLSGAPAWQAPSSLGIPGGSGTAGNVAMWSSSNTLGEAPITVDDGIMTLFGTIQLDDLGAGIVHSDLNGELTSSLVDITNDVTGILPVDNGGTGVATVTTGAILLGNGTSAMTELPVGSDGAVLTVVIGAPSWQALSTGLTLTGNGTTSPFGINLGNANSWSAMQTFSSGATVGTGLTLSTGAVINTDGSDGNTDDILTSQGSSSSPQWKSLSDLSIVTGSGGSGELTYWNGSSDITSSSNLTFDGASLNLTDAHLTSIQTTAPTEAEAANIGTGGTSTLATATDVAGKITIATGTGPLAGLQTTITFNAAYNVAPIVTITPINAASAAIQAYVTSTLTTFTVSFGVAPAASTTYEFFYHVIETQDAMNIQ